VLHVGEEQRFVALLRQARPAWLLLAIALQLATYACSATIWYRALRRASIHHSFMSLMGLGVAKLFTDQAIPSAGVGGTLLVVEALQRRGVSRGAAMAALLVDLVAYYAGFALILGTSLIFLWMHQDLNLTILAMAGVFVVLALAIPGVIFWLTRPDQATHLSWLWRVSMLRLVLAPIVEAPANIIRDWALLGQMLVLHVIIFLLDAGTLLAMLSTLGQSLPFASALASFMVASLTATVGLVPGGLGTFEGALVAMLTLFGLSLETALAAALLLRGVTFWLPMVPGLWLASREMTTRLPTPRGPKGGDA
jgi:uncharacterized protein (TIRG00374 family)